MKASYKLLQFYFKDPLPPAEEVSDLLYEHSFEIEGSESVGDDIVMELDVLTNRSHDALGHLGIAKDLGVILDRDIVHPLTLPEANYSADEGLKSTDHLDIKVCDSNLVPRVMKRLAVDIKVGPSPDWLVEALASMGQKSINNVVDITNFVMYETSQPVHAFDFDKMAGGNKKVMEVRMAESGEQITMLDGKEIELDDKTLVWADEERPLDIAGIKGGNNSGVDESTTRIVLSICNFEPINIRKTRQRHKIVTDASRRFEHHLSPDFPAVAMERLSMLLVEFAGARMAKDIIDIYPKPQEEATATLRVDELNSLVGINLSDSDVEEILDRMKHADYDWQKDGDEYKIKVPFERLDVREKHEIVEEVARYYGYKNVKSALAPTDDFTPKIHKGFYYNSFIKKQLVEDLGFSELYNYVMSGEGELEFENSLVEGMSHLRSDMTGTLKKNLSLNIKNADVLGLDQIRLFELNKVAYLDGEHWALGIGVKNAKGYKKEKEIDVVESTIKALDEAMGAKGEWKVQELPEGVIAECNVDEWIKDLPTPDSYGDVLSATSDTKFTPYSTFPFVLRDIAVWTPEGTKAEDVLDMIRSEAEGTGWLVQSRLFDQFSRDGRTSYAYKLVFQDMEKTLTDPEVTEVMGRIEAKLAQESGFEVR